MKIKIIEFFGINGVGKSYNEALLRELLNSKNINTLSRREAVILYSQKIIKLEILDKITLLYFKYIEKFKKKKINKKKNFYKNIKNTKKKIKFLNIFRRRYNNICKKIYIDYCKTNKPIKKIVNKIISIQNKKNKNLFRNWCYEMFAAYHIIEKINPNSKIRIYLCDEGFLQRSFLIMYSSIRLKNKINLLKEYIKYIPKPDLCIYLLREKKIVKKIHYLREKRKEGVWIEQKLLREFYNFEKQIFNNFKNKVLFLKIKNNNFSVKKNIKKII